MKTYCRRPVFIVLLIAALAALTGCRDLNDKPEAFVIDVDSIQVEGGVSDMLSQEVTVRLDGNPVSLTGSDFNESVDVTAKTGFALEATDNAGNKSTLTVEIE